jgi:hypothetical protein
MYDADNERPNYSRLDKILLIIVGFFFTAIIVVCFYSYELYSFFNG